MTNTITDTGRDGRHEALRERLVQALQDFVPDAAVHALAEATATWAETCIRVTYRETEVDEDAADAAAYDRVVARLAGGETELVPWQVHKRISAGESPVRVWREQRGLTQTELAARAGLNQGDISNIESGKRGAQFTTMVKIARALDIDLDDLAPPNDQD